MTSQLNAPMSFLQALSNVLVRERVPTATCRMSELTVGFSLRDTFIRTVSKEVRSGHVPDVLNGLPARIRDDVVVSSNAALKSPNA